MPPNLVQERNAPRTGIDKDHYLFAVCQHGVEATIKGDLLHKDSSLRLAFSRPGLLTFKVDCQDPVRSEQRAMSLNGGAGSGLADQIGLVENHWAVRLAGISLGNVRGELGEELASAVLELEKNCDGIHVFQRDRSLPGERGFEPGPNELTEAVCEVLSKQRELRGLPSLPMNCVAGAGDRVLDVVVVEPNHWLIGSHRVNSTTSAWPGGVISVGAPAEMISRAYLKISEALLWSQLPIEPGDRIVEIGSSPGGAAQRLLDLGLLVTGVDPAEMDSRLLQHPRFEHWRSKSSGIRRRNFAKFRWLAADANVAPNYTLDAVEDIVNYRTSRFQGLLMTFKLSSYSLAQQLEDQMQRIRSWGFERVQMRQLASNRRECCVVACRPNRPPRRES
ncbi:MAG: hypothetical protein KDB22_08920 [Planctomycetales bacterium]|nr:hypothetical protein [Planctomycetales bacterium]